MSLKAKINSAVDKAFKAAGDLVVQGQLSVEDASNYDFSLRKTVSSTETLIVEVILQSTQKPLGDVFKTTALMKSGILFGSYDTLTVNNLSYSIVDYTDDGFVITAILVRGKS